MNFVPIFNVCATITNIFPAVINICTIMVPYKERYVLRMLLLEIKNILKILQCHFMANALVMIRVKIIPKKYDFPILSTLYGILPKGPAVNIRYN